MRRSSSSAWTRRSSASQASAGTGEATRSASGPLVLDELTNGLQTLPVHAGEHLGKGVLGCLVRCGELAVPRDERTTLLARNPDTGSVAGHLERCPHDAVHVEPLGVVVLQQLLFHLAPTLEYTDPHLVSKLGA